MPLSYEEAYGVTAAAKKKKEEDRKYLESVVPLSEISWKWYVRDYIFLV